MKKIVLLLMVSLLCACSANTETDKSEPNKKDAYCSDETDKSSACGIDESADMSGYKEKSVCRFGYAGGSFRISEKGKCNPVFRISKLSVVCGGTACDE